MTKWLGGWWPSRLPPIQTQQKARKTAIVHLCYQILGLAGEKRNKGSTLKKVSYAYSYALGSPMQMAMATQPPWPHFTYCRILVHNNVPKLGFIYKDVIRAAI